MVNLILAFNYCVNKEMENSINYIGEFDSDSDREFSDDDFEYTDEYTKCYALTGYAYPKIERDDLINTMLTMGLRHILDFS